jgi:hypothetical protein
MPVGGDEYPAVLANLGQEGSVGRPHVGRDVLLVDAISNASPVELFGDFWTVPIFVKVES